MGGPGSGRKAGVKNQSKNKLKQSNQQKIYNETRRRQKESNFRKTSRSQNRQMAARAATMR
jgi:hypothetical protein